MTPRCVMNNHEYMSGKITGCNRGKVRYLWAGEIDLSMVAWEVEKNYAKV